MHSQIKGNKYRVLRQGTSKSSKELSEEEGIEPKYIHFKTNLLCHQDVYKRLADMRKALADLRGKLKSGSSEEASFWQEEMQKMKEENDRAWRARLERMESCLSEREEELRRVQAGNEELLRTLDRGGVPEQTPHGGRTDSAFEDDEECNIKANSPTQCTRSGCERLEQRLSESEQRADQLNLLLNRKLIELNKLQLSLSKQTKEMIELEKSYLQLQCRMRRNAAKPIASKLCSRKPAFVTKNIIPRSSPPASPQL